MIDWIDCVVPIRHKIIDSGGRLVYGPGGVVLNEFVSRAFVPGSYDSSISCKTQNISDDGYGSELFISGNPVKFLQGHNIFGIDDPDRLLFLVLEKILEFYSIAFTDSCKRAILSGNYIIYRLDINYSYSLPSHLDVKQWLVSASVMTKSRHGQPYFKGNTLYWGLGSRRWFMKAYSKFTEISSRKKGHRLPRELATDSDLVGFTTNLLRIELSLKSMELKKLSERVFSSPDFYSRFLKSYRPMQIFTDYLEKIDMTRTYKASFDSALELPAAVRSSYTLWLAGFDMACRLHKSTFYRHRKIILDLLDVDISLPYAGDSEVNVVPFLRPLTAEVATVPDNLIKFMVS